jgi:2-oxoisovalerate dehydrogenase E2 component (dihydrolipoyl transacylase)
MEQVKLPLEQDIALELRGYNRLMVQKMQASLQIPHMVYADEIDVTSLRTRYKHDLPFLPFCIKALSLSLAKYPLLNSSYDAASNQVLLWADHNIGVAMDTPRGLIVPVIKHVQTKSISEIALDLQRLKDSAKNNNSSVSPEDLQGATFTLSNIGVIGGGGTYMSPIVTSPQVAIGALGNIQRVPRFVAEDSMDVQEAYIVNVSWAGDHRVIDGATMARFQKEWKSYLQDPIRMIRSMK